MNQHFERLFMLPHGLQLEGAPVVILAGALLQENRSGKVLAQLKFQNAAEQTVKDITVKVIACDANGEALENPVTFTYRDLHLAQYYKTGDKTPIYMPENTISFQVELVSVTYADGNIFRPETPDKMQPLTHEIIKSIQAEKESARQERAKLDNRRLARGARPALIAVAVVTLLCIAFTWYATQFDYNIESNILPRYVLALLPAVICLVATFFVGRNPAVLKIAMVVTIVLLVLKLMLYLCAFYFYEMYELDIYWIIARWVNDANIRWFGEIGEAIEEAIEYEPGSLLVEIHPGMTDADIEAAFDAADFQAKLRAWLRLSREISPIVGLIPNVLSSGILVVINVLRARQETRRIMKQISEDA